MFASLRISHIYHTYCIFQMATDVTIIRIVQYKNVYDTRYVILCVHAQLYEYIVIKKKLKQVVGSNLG